MTDLSLADVLAARSVIRGSAERTPLVPSQYLEGLTGQPFLLKLENLQPIGAFKLRGALNAVAGLAQDAPGLVCCSTGNHGRGVAYAARERGMRAVICMSRLVPQVKLQAIRALGAEIRIVGQSQDEAELETRRLADEEGLVEISPFDDPAVIAGQGTIGLEILEAHPEIGTILIPLSGGGLAAGIALAARAIKPGIRIVGVSMDRGAAMHASIAAGSPVEVTEVPSLADSLGGGLGAANRYSFQLCRDLLDEIVLVTEAEIYRALQALYFEDRIVAEGASAVGIAAVLAGRLTLLPAPVVAVITGQNTDMGVHADIMAGRGITLGDLVVEGRPWVP